MSIDIVIKFGGSAITVKDRLETTKDKELAHACSVVHHMVQQGQKVVVVHGAGSFGHHQAKKYGVNNGCSHLNTADKSILNHGFCLTRASVTKLNNLVTERLCLAGVNAVGVQSFGFWETDDGDVIQHNTELVSDIIKRGFVPVLHGDCVFDRTKGTKILSGDVIIRVLCKELSVPDVIFLTDVDGIYDKDPRESDAVLLTQIDIDRNGVTSLHISTGMPEYDVTGGIELKIKTAKDIVLASDGRARVRVCNVICDASKILSRELDSSGTVITLKD